VHGGARHARDRDGAEADGVLAAVVGAGAFCVHKYATRMRQREREREREREKRHSSIDIFRHL
jgi:hypothetical protein